MIAERQSFESLFACAHLIQLLSASKDSRDDAVKKILSDHIDDSLVSSVALELAMKDQKPVVEPIVAAIKAEYKLLTPDPLGGHRTSDRLNSLFQTLRQSLTQEAN